MIPARRTIIALLAVLALALTACGDDSPGSTTEATADDGSGDTSATTAAAPTGGGGDAGFLTIGDETITLDSALCYLQPQDAAAGGGQILATAQGFGTNAAGDQISADFTRYSEESQFAGDDINVTVGDPFSDSSYGLSASLDIGGVSVDGNTVSASDFTFLNFDDGSELAGALQINC